MKQRPIIECKSCGKSRPHRGRGLCNACYHHPEIRSVHKPTRRLSYHRPIITCANCGKQKPHHGRGICKNCYHRSEIRFQHPTKTIPFTKKQLEQIETGVWNSVPYVEIAAKLGRTFYAIRNAVYRYDLSRNHTRRNLCRRKIIYQWKKLGIRSPEEIADRTGYSVSHIKRRLSEMTKDGTLK